jgi:hypothetical protein
MNSTRCYESRGVGIHFSRYYEPPMRAEDNALLAQGVALFNEGEYFACHEVWEELWMRSAGDERTALQGLIQAAAALLHARQGNRRGALSVYGKAVTNLCGIADESLGLGLADFLKALAAYFAAVEETSATPSPPQLCLQDRTM